MLHLLQLFPSWSLGSPMGILETCTIHHSNHFKKFSAYYYYIFNLHINFVSLIKTGNFIKSFMFFKSLITITSNFHILWKIFPGEFNSLINYCKLYSIFSYVSLSHRDIKWQLVIHHFRKSANNFHMWMNLISIIWWRCKIKEDKTHESLLISFWVIFFKWK